MENFASMDWFIIVETQNLLMTLYAHTYWYVFIPALSKSSKCVQVCINIKRTSSPPQISSDKWKHTKNHPRFNCLWGVRCHKLFRAWIGNYIPQNTEQYNYWSMTLIPISGAQLLKYCILTFSWFYEQRTCVWNSSGRNGNSIGVILPTSVEFQRHDFCVGAGLWNVQKRLILQPSKQNT